MGGRSHIRPGRRSGCGGGRDGAEREGVIIMAKRSTKFRKITGGMTRKRYG